MLRIHAYAEEMLLGKWSHLPQEAAMWVMEVGPACSCHCDDVITKVTGSRVIMYKADYISHLLILTTA